MEPLILPSKVSFLEQVIRGSGGTNRHLYRESFSHLIVERGELDLNSKYEGHSKER